jgi:hypothetical protein
MWMRLEGAPDLEVLATDAAITLARKLFAEYGWGLWNKKDVH